VVTLFNVFTYVCDVMSIRFPPDRISSRDVDPATALLLASLSAIGLATAAKWGWSIISKSSIGLDVSDEGYYLSVVEFPGLIPHAPTDYGAYLRNLWILTGRNIPAFRIAALCCSSVPR
jgi:hypothetical protein